jgi:molybdopterin converting factor small subunit
LRGTVRARHDAKYEEQLMNVVPNQKLEGTETELDGGAAGEVENGIRDFVRNDVAYLRRPGEGPLENAESTVNNLNSLIQRVAGTSLSEITNLISELESLREWLHAEGQRVQREISGYAHLSQATIKSTRMIAENVAQWKRSADNLRNG